MIRLDPLFRYSSMGLIYIVDPAEKLLRQTNEKLPVVVNISYGPPHKDLDDGTGSFEVFMDKIFAAANKATRRSISFCGRKFSSTRTRALVQVLPGQRKLLRWRLQPSGLDGEHHGDLGAGWRGEWI